MKYSEIINLIISKTKYTDSLEEILTRKEEHANQDIYVRDIYVLHPNRINSIGERNKEKYPNISTVFDRLLIYIQSLFDIGDIYHKAYHAERIAEEIYNTHNCSMNHITRILLPEYSLYTQLPMSLENYELLIDKILKIAKTKSENLHILLSSIAILLSDGTLLNTCLYIQCGKEPKIHVICKARESWPSLGYINTKPFYQQTDFDGSMDFIPDNISPFIANNEKLIISNNSVFIVETAGEAQYLQAIDICYDNCKRHSENLLKKFTDFNPNNDFTIMPHQVDHIVTSNYLDVTSNYFNSSRKITSNLLTHVDAEYSINSIEYDLNNKVTLSNINNMNSLCYEKYYIGEKLNGFRMINPPFGSSPVIIATAERKLGNYLEEYKNKISKRNEAVIKHLHELYSSKNINNSSDNTFKMLNQINYNKHNLFSMVLKTGTALVEKINSYRNVHGPC